MDDIYRVYCQYGPENIKVHTFSNEHAKVHAEKFFQHVIVELLTGTTKGDVSLYHNRNIVARYEQLQ